MKNLTATLCLAVALLLGSAGVSWSHDFGKGAAAYRSGDYATVLREWKPLAEQGNADAQYNQGLMYALGRGVPQDDKTAVKWYRLAADQGDADAQKKLKEIKILLSLSPKEQRNLASLEARKGNYKKALNFLEQASGNGDHIASWKLAGNYRGTLQGWGIKKDLRKARYYEKLAAEQGSPSAQSFINAITPWWKFWAFYGWWRFW